MTKLILCLQFLWPPLLCSRFSRDEAQFMSSVSLDTIVVSLLCCRFSRDEAHFMSSVSLDTIVVL